MKTKISLHNELTIIIVVPNKQQFTNEIDK